MKPDLLITMTMPGGYGELLADDFTVHYLPRVAADDPALDAIAGKIRFVLTNGTIGISAALIARLDKLEIISAFGAGVENIDIAAARRAASRFQTARAPTPTAWPIWPYV